MAHSIRIHSLSWWKSHSNRNSRWLVTSHPQSGSRERWRLLLSPLLYLVQGHAMEQYCSHSVWVFLPHFRSFLKHVPRDLVISDPYNRYYSSLTYLHSEERASHGCVPTMQQFRSSCQFCVGAHAQACLYLPFSTCKQRVRNLVSHLGQGLKGRAERGC